MSDQESKSLDVLGLKPLSESVNTVTKGTVDGLSALLSRICLPAAEEFGLLWKDKISGWRASNAAKICQKARDSLNDKDPNDFGSAHPRVIGNIIESGSWEDDDRVQNMWAGLLTSSCDEDGKNQTNIIFINLLKLLTAKQAITLSVCCNRARLVRLKSNTIDARPDLIASDEALKVLNYSNLHDMDVDLDYLREVGLLSFNAGISASEENKCYIHPSSLGLSLFVRAAGFVGSPLEYFEM